MKKELHGLNRVKDDTYIGMVANRLGVSKDDIIIPFTRFGRDFSRIANAVSGTIGLSDPTHVASDDSYIRMVANRLGAEAEDVFIAFAQYGRNPQMISSDLHRFGMWL